MIIKVCGITNPDDLLVAVEAGANALGFIFYPPSPRYVTPDAFARLAELVPQGVRKIGVFVGEPLDLPGLDAAQIYGPAPSRIPVWRAYRISDSIPALDPSAEAVLLDGAANGISFDWSMLSALPPADASRIVIAGGLDGSNVADAIRAARPFGVDACSRLEASPGNKDHAKVRAFAAAAATAFRRSNLD
ncbi:MAG: phosphoribosylanthranilate isomerase [Bryobacteraceae bacterium]